MFEFLCCDTEGRLCSASLFRFEARAWLQVMLKTCIWASFRVCSVVVLARNMFRV